MSDIEKHLRHLRDVGGRSNLEAARAIEALRGEVERLRSTFNAGTVEQILKVTQDRAEKAEAENARLKGALEVFAAIKADDGDTFDKWDDSVVIRCEITVGDLKKARKALGETT